MKPMARPWDADETDDRSIIDSILKDMECSVSYLEDSPDEALESFGSRLIGICERLVKIEESLLKENSR